MIDTIKMMVITALLNGSFPAEPRDPFSAINLVEEQASLNATIEAVNSKSTAYFHGSSTSIGAYGVPLTPIAVTPP